MITSRTIQHNSDRTYDISFILLSHNEENDQKVWFRDLKCRNGAQNQNLREKLSKTGPIENFLLWSKSTVNGQSHQSTIWSKSTVNRWRVLTWQCDVTLGLTWQYAKRNKLVECVERGAHGVRGNWHVRRVEACEGYWRRVVTREARAREAENSAGMWRHVWCSFWPFLVRFYSGLAILSLYAFSLAIEWAECWYPRVTGTVGMTTVTRFWQWLLDEGEVSRRTPKMSIGARKSKEWL